MKKVFCKILILAISIMPAISATAANLETNDSPILKSTFTNEPNEEQIELMEKERLPIYEDKSSREITSDGYQRVYGAVTFDTSTINNRYSFIGQCSAYNATSSYGTLQYTQGITKTTSWNVNTTVSGKSEVKAPFLAKLEASLGVAVGTSTTTSKSSTAMYSMSVSPYKTGYIDAYHKAGYGSGSIKYYDYTPSGNYARSGNLTVSGYAIVQGSVHYDAYEK